MVVHEARVKDSWDQTLQVQIFAINGDGSNATGKYIRALKLANFANRRNWRHRRRVSVVQGTRPVRLAVVQANVLPVVSAPHHCPSDGPYRE